MGAQKSIQEAWTLPLACSGRSCLLLKVPWTLAGFYTSAFHLLLKSHPKSLALLGL